MSRLTTAKEIDDRKEICRRLDAKRMWFETDVTVHVERPFLCPGMIVLCVWNALRYGTC